MPTRQQLIDALDRADAAGDEAAAREIAAMIQGPPGDVTAPITSPQASAPPQDEGFLAQVKNAMVGGVTTSKAMAQGLPGVGTWTDELASKAIAATANQVFLHPTSPTETRLIFPPPSFQLISVTLRHRFALVKRAGRMPSTSM